MDTTQLWVPPGVRETFKKAPPPRMGNKYGHWAGRDLDYLELPGGAVLQFDLSRLTLNDYRQMRDHYQINSSLAVLTFMMHQQDWHIESENKQQAQFIEDDLREHWTELNRGLSQANWAGFSPMVVDWKNDGPSGRIIIDKFKDLVPEDCRVNWKEVLGYAPPDKAKPKFYEYDGIVQYPGNSEPIPPENTLWYPMLMENGDYYGRKLLRAAFPSWFYSILIHLFSNRYFERFGEPVPIGRAPFDDDVTVNGESVSGRDAMLDILNNLRNRSVVVLPDDRIQVGDSGRSEYSYEIEYLESQMRGADFERYLTRLDEEMSLAVFTPLLMMRTAEAGSYNLGTTHTQMYLWMLNALAADRKDYLDKHIVKRMKDFNFGPNAPKAKWVPRPLGKENAETVRAMVTELLRGRLATADLEQLGDSIGIDLTEATPPAEDPSNPLSIAHPDNPQNPKNQPESDPRIGRPGRTAPSKRARPGDRPTSSKVTARVCSQFDKALREDKLGEWQPDLGFRRQMTEALGVGEWFTDGLYRRLNAWIVDAAPVFDSTEAFAEAFERVMDNELGDMVEQA